MSVSPESLGATVVPTERWIPLVQLSPDARAAEVTTPAPIAFAVAPFAAVLLWLNAAVADAAAALVVAASAAPIVATLLTAVLQAKQQRLSVVADVSDPILAALINLAAAWLALATPLWLFGLGRAGHVNRSAFEKLENRVAEVRAWASFTRTETPRTCTNATGDCCRVIAHRSITTHVQAVEGGLKRPDVAWVLGTGYIALWRRLNAAEALLPYIEPLDQVRMRADRLSSRLAESSLPGAAATEARLGEARRALCASQVCAIAPPPRQRARRRSDHQSAGEMAESDVRALIGQIQCAVDDFRTDRYAGLVQARNLLLGTAGIAGAALYAMLWLTLQTMGATGAIQWGVGFYLVGALVGVMNLLYVQASSDSSVEDYSLSSARVVVAPQLAGIAALLGVLVTAMAAMTQGDGQIDAAKQFGRAIYFLPAAGFALSPGVVLSGLRKRTEDIKHDLKTSRAGGHGVS